MSGTLKPCRAGNPFAPSASESPDTSENVPADVVISMSGSELSSLTDTPVVISSRKLGLFKKSFAESELTRNSTLPDLAMTITELSGLSVTKKD